MTDHFAVMAGRLLTASTVQSAIDEASNAASSSTPAGGGDAVVVEHGGGGRPKSGVLVECRICQEDGDESCMEAPCSCKGSLKVKTSWQYCTYVHCSCLKAVAELNRCVFQYAHRTCVQRWCDEKGDTICEICLQVKFWFPW